MAWIVRRLGAGELVATARAPTIKPDNGCHATRVGHCVDCHLERCKYDEQNGMLTIHSRRTRYMVKGLGEMGWPVKEIHHRIHVPLSTVWRILREA